MKFVFTRTNFTRLHVLNMYIQRIPYTYQLLKLTYLNRKYNMKTLYIHI